MKLFIIIPLAAAVGLLSCNEKKEMPTTTPTHSVVPIESEKKIANFKYYPNEGYEPDGSIYTHFDCPDDVSFSPINIRQWDKVPVVNGRLPTHEEVKYGMAIHHYGGEGNPYVKPYDDITLPRLAYVHSPSNGKQEIVVVIQIVKSAKDTVAGYRYLTGGVGGSLLRNFHFLTAEEVKKVTG